MGKSLAGDWDTGTAAQTQLPSLWRLLRPVTAVCTQVTQTHTLEWPQCAPAGPQRAGLRGSGRLSPGRPLPRPLEPRQAAQVGVPATSPPSVLAPDYYYLVTMMPESPLTGASPKEGRGQAWRSWAGGPRSGPGRGLTFWHPWPPQTTRPCLEDTDPCTCSPNSTGARGSPLPGPCCSPGWGQRVGSPSSAFALLVVQTGLGDISDQGQSTVPCTEVHLDTHMVARTLSCSAGTRPPEGGGLCDLGPVPQPLCSR